MADRLELSGQWTFMASVWDTGKCPRRCCNRCCRTLCATAPTSPHHGSGRRLAGYQGSPSWAARCEDARIVRSFAFLSRQAKCNEKIITGFFNQPLCGSAGNTCCWKTEFWGKLGLAF